MEKEIEKRYNINVKYDFGFFMNNCNITYINRDGNEYLLQRNTSTFDECVDISNTFKKDMSHGELLMSGFKYIPPKNNYIYF